VVQAFPRAKLSSSQAEAAVSPPASQHQIQAAVTPKLIVGTSSTPTDRQQLGKARVPTQQSALWQPEPEVPATNVCDTAKPDVSNSQTHSENLGAAQPAESWNELKFSIHERLGQPASYSVAAASGTAAKAEGQDTQPMPKASLSDIAVTSAASNAPQAAAQAGSPVSDSVDIGAVQHLPSNTCTEVLPEDNSKALIGCSTSAPSEMAVDQGSVDQGIVERAKDQNAGAHDELQHAVADQAATAHTQINLDDSDAALHQAVQGADQISDAPDDLQALVNAARSDVADEAASLHFEPVLGGSALLTMLPDAMQSPAADDAPHQISLAIAPDVTAYAGTTHRQTHAKRRMPLSWHRYGRSWKRLKHN